MEGAPKARSPRVEIKQQTDEKIVFLLTGTDASVANALRRVIIAEVVCWLSLESILTFNGQKSEITNVADHSY